MFKIITVLVVFAITACSGGGSSGKDGPIKTISSMWYGDSRCVDNLYITNRDCVSGRKLIDLDYINPSHDRIIIHLGYNDMAYIPVNIWGAHLEYLISGIKDKVWCVLPTWANHIKPYERISGYREEMLRICKNTVDPQIEGYDLDGIHYTDVNYRQILDVYESIMAI